MKVVTVIAAQSFIVCRWVGTSVYVPDLIAAIAERYNFLKFPTTPEEIILSVNDASKPITFELGRRTIDGREILIQALQIFGGSVMITTRTNTDDADLVLNDAMTWATQEKKIQVEQTRPGIGHGSQMEIELEKVLPDLFPSLKRIGELITSHLDETWDSRPGYELISLNWWFDRTSVPAFAPNIFRLDRREGIKFEQNTYWSEAPLTTPSHLAVLEEIERTCIRGLSS